MKTTTLVTFPLFFTSSDTAENRLGDDTNIGRHILDLCKHPQQYSIVVVSTTVQYLGPFRSFLGEERGETSPKLLILITDIAWFYNFEQR